MNHIIIMGRLTRDPEQKTTASGTALTKYTLAVSRKTGGDADYFDCTAFDRMAEFAAKYFKKGKRVLVAGRVQTGKYTNQNGQNVRTWDVIVNTQEFADGKDEQQETPAQKPAQDNGADFLDAVDDPGLPWNS